MGTRACKTAWKKRVSFKSEIVDKKNLQGVYREKINYEVMKR